MSTVTAIPHAGQPPFLRQTFDPSTSQIVPDTSEPTFSSGGAPDELSAAGREYADSRRNSFALAHAEADADDLRAQLAERDWTAEQFLHYLREHCPGVIATCSAHAYVHVDCLPDQPAITEWREARVRFADGSPLRNLKTDTWRELAGRIEAEHLTRKGMGRAVPVVPVGA